MTPRRAGVRSRLSTVPDRLPTPLDPATGLRTVMGRFATGVTVVSVGGDAPHAMTANSFTSVSLAPPMVLCCIARTARMHESVVAAGSFGVSVLGADQQEESRWFADWRRPAGTAQFDRFPHVRGRRSGAPLLTEALAWLECSVRAVHEAGDHSVVVGEVLACGHGGEPGPALTFYAGSYHRIDPAPAQRRDREKDAS